MEDLDWNTAHSDWYRWKRWASGTGSPSPAELRGKGDCKCLELVGRWVKGWLKSRLGEVGLAQNYWRIEEVRWKILESQQGVQKWLRSVLGREMWPRWVGAIRGMSQPSRLYTVHMVHVPCPARELLETGKWIPRLSKFPEYNFYSTQCLLIFSGKCWGLDEGSLEKLGIP